MNIAFYAPLKSPDAVTPSGDRRMARALVDALTFAGHRVNNVSNFRSFDKFGIAERQVRLQALGRRLADRYLEGLRRHPQRCRPSCWFTYHLYHKAPDWLGPRICAALGIPYLVAEASYAPKQAGGPWSMGHEAAAAAIAVADAVFALNPADEVCVKPLLRPGVPSYRLTPFLPDLTDYSAGSRAQARTRLGSQYGIAPSASWLLCVGMLRSGDKYRSYEVLADAVARLRATNWSLIIIGDGGAETSVRQLFRHHNSAVFVGRRTKEELISWYCASDIFVWPAIREAFGMAALEAQAAGLPVVAGFTPGLAQIVEHERTGILTESGNSRRLAAAVDELLSNPGRRAGMAKAAREKVELSHGIELTARILDGAIAATLR